MERFRIHVADEVLDDLRARLIRTRWPDQIPGIGWKQGTNLEWLQRLVSYWTHDFDWRAWEGAWPQLESELATDFEMDDGRRKTLEGLSEAASKLIEERGNDLQVIAERLAAAGPV